MDIKIGPFVTEHHKMVGDSAFRSALESWIQHEVYPRLSGITDRIEGSVTTQYDDPKFLGPNSAVKYRYELKLQCWIGEDYDEARATLIFDPDQQSFDEHPNERLSVITSETRRAEEELFAAGDDFSAAFDDPNAELKCPSCQGILQRVQGPGPNREGANCPDCGFSFHRPVESGSNSSAPASKEKKGWWKFWN